MTINDKSIHYYSNSQCNQPFKSHLQFTIGMFSQKWFVIRSFIFLYRMMIVSCCSCKMNDIKYANKIQKIEMLNQMVNMMSILKNYIATHLRVCKRTYTLRYIIRLIGIVHVSKYAQTARKSFRFGPCANAMQRPMVLTGNVLRFENGFWCKQCH